MSYHVNALLITLGFSVKFSKISLIREFYSGKKRKHTLKTQIVVDKKTKQVICTAFANNKRHDFRLFKESKTKIIHDIYLSATRENALKAWQAIVKTYGTKYSKFFECLNKDQKELLSFYDLPAEHWIHLRTINPIESSFATVKHRTKKSKNCFSRKTIIAATFKLLKEAEKRWTPLRGKQLITEVIKLEQFINGVNKNEINNQDNNHNKYAA